MFDRVRSAASRIASGVRNTVNRITGRTGGAGRSSY